MFSEQFKINTYPIRMQSEISKYTIMKHKHTDYVNFNIVYRFFINRKKMFLHMCAC